jgi:hypothetical protein
LPLKVFCCARRENFSERLRADELMFGSVDKNIARKAALGARFMRMGKIFGLGNF